MNKERTLIKGADSTKVDDDDIDYMCQEKKEEKDSPTLKMLWMHQYEE